MSQLPSDKKFINQISQIRQINIDYDVVFLINQKPNARRMIGHSIILSVRSYYFHTAFQRMDKINKFDTTNRYQFQFPEYTFEIFDEILKFIYGNEVNVLTKNSEFVINLMIAAKRFELTDMVEYLQSYFIETRSSWIRENICNLIPMAFDNEDFQQLRELIINLICEDTKLFLNSHQFNEMSERHLIKFLQIDDLSIEEFHIWNAVLGWIIKKVTNLDKKDVTQWSNQEIDFLKTILYPFIPYIRFFQISSFKYWDYIHKFNKILPKELMNEILKYYLKGLPPKNYPLLPLRNVRNIDSDIISAIQAEIISLWIENKNPNRLMGLEWEFKFKLLYSTRRHGNSVKKFHELCDNKGATILVVKTDFPEEIIGGFNPISWNNDEINKFESENSPRYSPNDNDPMDTEEESTVVSSLITLVTSSDSSNTSNDDVLKSFEQTDGFLFSFNKNNENKMGKVLGIWNSIHSCGECGPCFGTTDLWISPQPAHSKSHNIPYIQSSNFGYHRQNSYEINLRDEPGGFQFVNYEVFEVVHV